MVTEVRLQVFFAHRKNNTYMYTSSPKKVQISWQNQVQTERTKKNVPELLFRIMFN